MLHESFILPLQTLVHSPSYPNSWGVAWPGRCTCLDIHLLPAENSFLVAASSSASVVLHRGFHSMTHSVILITESPCPPALFLSLMATLLATNILLMNSLLQEEQHGIFAACNLEAWNSNAYLKWHADALCHNWASWRPQREVAPFLKPTLMLPSTLIFHMIGEREPMWEFKLPAKWLIKVYFLLGHSLAHLLNREELFLRESLVLTNIQIKEILAVPHADWSSHYIH